MKTLAVFMALYISMRYTPAAALTGQVTGP